MFIIPVDGKNTGDGLVMVVDDVCVLMVSLRSGRLLGWLCLWWNIGVIALMIVVVKAV